MPIKLQVIRDGADSSEPADYLYEQDRITIGRGSNNDLTLPDQKISKRHAEIRSSGGQYELFDCDSKNHTFVHGSRVGEDEGYVLSSGDVFSVGDFRVEFVPLFMPSSEKTAYADPEEEKNVFEKPASYFAQALKGFIETYSYLPPDKRDAELNEALQDHLGKSPEKMGEHAVVQYLTECLSPDEGEDDEAASRTQSTDSEAVDAVVATLLRGTARMISIPTHFWREFSGNTVVHPPDRAFVHKADLDTLRDHLLDPSLTDEEREKRLEHVREAVDTLVAHNVAMLAGYRSAVRDGVRKVLQQVNPSDIEGKSSEGGGGLRSIFGGGGSGATSSLDRLKANWKEMYENAGQHEEQYFRPSYIEEYLRRMADAWGVEKEDIAEEKARTDG
jgi:predicted component of type VI protein secretion system